MKLALAQINPTVGDFQENTRKIMEIADRAAGKGAQMVIFPELAVCGYPPCDLLLRKQFIEANRRAVKQIAAENKKITIVAGFVDRLINPDLTLHNAVAVIHEGKIEAIRHKTLLTAYDDFNELSYFTPAASNEAVVVGGRKFGFLIGEDILTDRNQGILRTTAQFRLSEYRCPVSDLVSKNPQTIINISAFTYSFNRETQRLELLQKLAKSTNVPVINVNRSGASDTLIFDGNSMAVNSDGGMIARATSFDEDLVLLDLDAKNGEIREQSRNKIANLYRALVTGTRNYASGSGFKKAVLGLSGGIDSAVTGAIACAALGADNVIGLSMPSPHSSTGSIEDARALARNLGISLHCLPIEPAMTSFEAMLKSSFTGLEPDVTEENIQARIRGMLVMSFSNKFGYLPLSTGNKSECAVGYATLYGDMCGGLSVISDVPKMTVYELARYINQVAVGEVIPASSIEKPPSAELRPGQTDQDSLPSYVVLDAIIEAYVERRLSLDKIVELGYDRQTVLDVVRRIHASEYKRKQAAPGLKTGGRSGGFNWHMPIVHRFQEGS